MKVIFLLFVLNCKVSLYVLVTSTLSVLCIVIFSPSLFYVLKSVFKSAKVLRFKSNLSIVHFMVYDFCLLRNCCLTLSHKRFSCMFSSGSISFLVVRFMFISC